jgi:hypothetical protein
MVRIARIRKKELTAVQALASSSPFHLGNPPCYPKHRRRRPSSPTLTGAEDDPEQDPNAEKEEK